MKLSKTAIGLLTQQYRAVLRGALVSMIGIGAVQNSAVAYNYYNGATTVISENTTDWSFGGGYVSGTDVILNSTNLTTAAGVNTFLVYGGGNVENGGVLHINNVNVNINGTIDSKSLYAGTRAAEEGSVAMVSNINATIGKTGSVGSLVIGGNVARNGAMARAENVVLNILGNANYDVFAGGHALGGNTEVLTKNYITNTTLNISGTVGNNVYAGGLVKKSGAQSTINNSTVNIQQGAQLGGFVSAGSQMSALDATVATSKVDVAKVVFSGTAGSIAAVDGYKSIADGYAGLDVYGDTETDEDNAYNTVGSSTLGFDNYNGIFAANIYDFDKLEILNSRLDGNAGNFAWMLGIQNINIQNSEMNNFHNSENGGAVFANDDIIIYNSSFNNNSSDVYGGAMFAKGASPDDLTTVIINKANFSNNKAFIGGALMAGENTNFIITNSVFDSNSAKWGGALYSYTPKDDGTSVGGFVDIRNTVFSNNVATGVGAVGLFSKSSLTDVVFENNQATDVADDGGGALFFGAESKTVLTGGLFDANTSAANGGAISTRTPQVANNEDAALDINKSKFVNNSAGINGGAIYNSFYNNAANEGFVSINLSSFQQNKAENGGAIYNDGTLDSEQNSASLRISDSDFNANIADGNGGAIYNSGTLSFSGINNFVGNMANGVANDIFNTGAMNVVAGTTNISGGITGSGSLSVDKGAELNIASSVISQSEFNLDGVLRVNLLENGVSGSVNADTINFGEDAELRLNITGTGGSYSIFQTDADITINTGGLYDVVNHGTAGIVVSMKSAEDIASDTGLSSQTSSTIVGMANATDNQTVVQIANRAQEELMNGNVDFVESEISKSKPESKPVAQSASASMQNQVLSLAASRMSAGGNGNGRSSGDAINANYGFWMQGLFNESKYSNQFHGYSRGMALGFDAKINSDMTAGLGYAYNSSSINAESRATDISTKSIFVYGQYKPNEWFVNATLNYAMSEYLESAEMFGLALDSEYDVNTIGGQIMGGYDFATGMTTQAGLRALHVSQGAYNNGLGDVSDASSDFLTGIAGVKYAFNIKTDTLVKWSPELRAALTYDVISDSGVANIMMPGGASYSVAGDRLSRAGSEIGIGLTAEYKSLEVSVNYDLNVHDSYTSQTGMLKFRYNF